MNGNSQVQIYEYCTSATHKHNLTLASLIILQLKQSLK